MGGTFGYDSLRIVEARLEFCFIGRELSGIGFGSATLEAWLGQNWRKQHAKSCHLTRIRDIRLTGDEARSPLSLGLAGITLSLPAHTRSVVRKVGYSRT